MKSRLVLAVAVGCLLAGCDSRSDPEKLQGDWQMREMWGWFKFDLPTVKGGPTVMSFNEEAFTFKNEEGPEHRVIGQFACDTTKSPKQITFKFEGRTVVGIYSVSGGTLRICVDKDDKVPPGTFNGGPGERPALLMFDRQRTQ